MPMTGDLMDAAIKTNILAIPGLSITQPDELTAFCNALGEAVVAYIQANAVVSTTVTGAVTTGAGAGGTVVGTGSGLIL